MDTLNQYEKYLREISKLNSAVALLVWDQRTYIPKGGHEARAEVVGKLSTMAFEMSVSDELGGYLEALERQDGLSEAQAASVRVVGKQYRRTKAIPATLFEQYVIDRSRSEAAWEEAKANGDFALFKPHLAKMVDYAKQFAEYYGYQDCPYDALLDEFEPGMTSRELKTIVEPLREKLVPLLRRLMEDGTPPDGSLIEGSFPLDRQHELSLRALRAINYDFEHGRMDDTVHPFTIGIAPGDVRITNRFIETMAISGLMSALHEGGHALYDLGMPAELHHLGLGNGASFGIHESQSRMWENMVGRSLPFWKLFRRDLVDVFPQLSSATAEDLYRAVNVVQPSLIRVEADEVTYNLHIMVRFEIEQALFDGSLAVADLPDAWNTAMEKYLGVRPSNNAEGVLQDVHWSGGMFGYFPSYMLGNLYSAQLLATIKREIPDLDARIESGDTKALLDWTREKIHRYGQIHEPKDLILKVTGESLSPSYFLDYIEAKFFPIYGL
ncbi:carboxypeptidase M32 [Candidatus Bipolaricaulota bacterium]|nr:carboxypeptidase M32 [Candidatus Bipolaricaulota bacterium]